MKLEIPHLKSNVPLKKFTVEANDVLMLLLSEKFYKEPLRSTVREILMNAIDAHIEAGIQRPVEVRLKQKHTLVNSSVLIIRDYGKGLTPQEIEEIYTTFGKSTKRHSDDVWGAFGLGAKSPFSVSKYFFVKTYQPQYAYTYMMTSEHGNLVYTLISKEQNKTNETGLEVIIPLENYSPREILESIKNVYWTTGFPIKLVGFDRRILSKIFLLPVYKEIEIDGHRLLFVPYVNTRSMLRIIYSGIERNEYYYNELINDITDDQIKQIARFLLRRVFYIVWIPKIGSLSLTPTREFINDEDEKIRKMARQLVSKAFEENFSFFKELAQNISIYFSDNDLYDEHFIDAREIPDPSNIQYIVIPSVLMNLEKSNAINEILDYVKYTSRTYTSKLYRPLAIIPEHVKSLFSPAKDVSAQLHRKFHMGYKRQKGKYTFTIAFTDGKGEVEIVNYAFKNEKEIEEFIAHAIKNNITIDYVYTQNEIRTRSIPNITFVTRRDIIREILRKLNYDRYLHERMLTNEVVFVDTLHKDFNTIQIGSISIYRTPNNSLFESVNEITINVTYEISITIDSKSLQYKHVVEILDKLGDWRCDTFYILYYISQLLKHNAIIDYKIPNTILAQLHDICEIFAKDLSK